MKWNCITSYCSFMIGLIVFRWYVVSAVRKHRFEIHPLCNSSTYGSALITHNGIGDIVSCTTVCMDNSQCESCTYDETIQVCSLNAVIRLDTPTCTQNVIYAQKREFKCLFSGAYKVCDLDLYAVPGELTGYIEVNLNGTWGTVCDDGWEEESNGAQNANVFCRSFGYSGGYPKYPLGSNPVIYNGLIAMDDVACSGSESDLIACSHLSLEANCGHVEDVQVICYA